MSGHHLPKNIDPFKQFDAGVRLDGFIELAKLSRLDNLLASQAGQVKVVLQFGRDEQSMAVLEGSVKAELSLVCQRCMKNSPFELNSEFSFAFIRKDSDIDSLPSEYEPLLLEQPLLELYQLVEEEIILALPIVHYHENDCASSRNEEQSEGDEDKPNPFAILETLKKP